MCCKVLSWSCKHTRCSVLASRGMEGARLGYLRQVDCGYEQSPVGEATRGCACMLAVAVPPSLLSTSPTLPRYPVPHLAHIPSHVCIPPHILMSLPHLPFLCTNQCMSDPSFQPGPSFFCRATAAHSGRGWIFTRQTLSCSAGAPCQAMAREEEIGEEVTVAGT